MGIVRTWATNDDYSYGYLIPFISAYLFWDMRHRLNGLEVKSAWLVLPPLILLVLISIYGILGSSGNISRPLVPVLFILFFTFCFGFDAFKRFALPLCFLIFMVPLPAILDRTFGVFLKSVSSQLGGLLVRLSGMSVHVSGNIIDLGTTQLQVVDACSGLRFVFPLLALGVIFAYLFEKSNWKRITLVLSTIPIAILTNGLRIGITGILTDKFGPEMAQGFFHDFSGWAIFMVAFGFLFVLSVFLRLFPPKGKPQHQKDMPRHDGPIRLKSKPILAALGTSACLLFLVGIFSLSTGSLPPVRLNTGIENFPLRMGIWQGNSVPVDSEIVETSGAESSFMAEYRNGNLEVVSLYIGYRGSAFLENENFFHSPTVCLPSSGWKTLKTSVQTIANAPPFGELKVTQMLIENTGRRQLVYFWFQTKDRSTHDKNINRFHLTLHALQKDNTHDLFIRTIMPIKKNESEEEAGKRMNLFVRETLTTLQYFLAENIQT
jgi:exosortase D (VPLPA-CTERM-specific)